MLTSVGCANDSGEARCPESVSRYDLYLYAYNHSQQDSVALLVITIDDSPWVKQCIACSALSPSNLVKRTTISGGPHQVRIAFGRFRKDATHILLGLKVKHIPFIRK